MHFIYTTRWAAAFNDVLAGWLAGVPKEWKELQKQGKKEFETKGQRKEAFKDYIQRHWWRTDWTREDN